MKDRNIVELSGIIGEDAKFGKTHDGKEYYTFSLSVNCFSKEMSDSTERTHSQVFCRIFVYDKRQLEYLRKINVHQGQRAIIFGRITSFRSEYKGNSYIANGVVCRDIDIVQTKSYKENAGV